MTLLPGYSYARSIDFEGNIVGRISKVGGLTFEYEYPPFRSPRQPSSNQAQYQEYVEQTIEGHHVWRGFRFGRYELNIDLCRAPEYSHVVQFRAEVQKSPEAADMVRMALSLLEPKR